MFEFSEEKFFFFWNVVNKVFQEVNSYHLPGSSAYKDNLLASFSYDDNGNRSQITYYLDGSETGDTADISYSYNTCDILS